MFTQHLHNLGAGQLKIRWQITGTPVRTELICRSLQCLSTARVCNCVQANLQQTNVKRCGYKTSHMHFVNVNVDHYFLLCKCGPLQVTYTGQTLVVFTIKKDRTDTQDLMHYHKIQVPLPITRAPATKQVQQTGIGCQRDTA